MHDPTDLPPAIQQAMQLIATSPNGSRTLRAAVEILGCYLRLDGPPPPPDESPDALDRLRAALKNQMILTGDEWAAIGLTYAGLYAPTVRNPASAAPVPPPPPTGTLGIAAPTTPDTGHPITVEDARAAAYVAIGMWRERRICNRRNDWWDRLRAATTPEEKLTCERMINAFGEALGLHRHEQGRAIAEKNPYLERIIVWPEDDIERRAVDKWR